MRSGGHKLKKPPNGASRTGINAQLPTLKSDRNWIRLRQDFGVTSYCIHAASPVKDSSQLLNNSTSQLLLMADTYVPMISSGTAGPLGVLHLPRMWQKVSLEAQGKLAAGYPGIGRGYDAMTCAALGLDEQAVKDFIKKNKPNYPQFEAWVKKNAKSLEPSAIEKHNAAVRGYNHDDETRKGILGSCSVADDASAPKDAVNLNNLDDWYEFHQAVRR